jgi:hypothetical protein
VRKESNSPSFLGKASLIGELGLHRDFIMLWESNKERRHSIICDNLHLTLLILGIRHDFSLYPYNKGKGKTQVM